MALNSRSSDKPSQQTIRRAIGTKQVGKAPLLTTDIRRIIEAWPDSVIGIRDCALVVVVPESLP